MRFCALEEQFYGEPQEPLVLFRCDLISRKLLSLSYVKDSP